MMVAPITFREASEYINRLHRHHRASVGCKFCISVLGDDEVMQTVAGDHGSLWDFTTKAQVSHKSIANASTFPQDYDFCGERTPYICGMSVPPVMMKRVVTRLIDSGVFDTVTKARIGGD